MQRRLGETVAVHQGWDATSRLVAQAITTGVPALDAVVSSTPGTPAQVGLVQQRSFHYRADGHLTRIDERLSGSRVFDLDRVGRVTAVRGPGWAERYRFDPAGNVVAAQWPATSDEEAAARGAREFTGTRVRRAGNVRYDYDADGRVTLRQHKRLSAKSRTWRYTWDAEGRLVGVTTPDGQRWRYSYDGLGRRIAEQRLGADGQTVVEQVTFAWDGTLLAEQAVTHPGVGHDGATTTWEWLPGEVRPLTQHQRTPAADAPQEWVDRQFYAIVSDLVGTPTDLVDETGTLAPQGRTPLWGAAPADSPCPLRFPGQYHDPESGLHYNVFRHYDPGTAAYTSPDPLGLNPGPNPRHYVPNPLEWLDPLGLAPGCGAAPQGARQTTILGENMTERVMPFAEATGSRTLGFGATSADEWAAMTPRQRYRLNDGMLRARIREGDDFRYIGQDPLRPPDVRARFDLTRSELLRLDERGIPYDIVSPDEVFKTIGRY